MSCVPFDGPTFAAKVEPHLDCMFRLARSLLQSDDLAWDAVQETLLRLWRGGELPEQPRGVLLRLVRPTSLHIRRGRRRRDHHEAVAAAEHASQRRDDCEDPVCIARCRELEQAIEASIAELPDGCRETFHLREIDGLDYAEIARRQGVPVGTVRSRLNRARRLLRTGAVPLLGEPLRVRAG